MPQIRFRTQDTRASWARKINLMLTGVPSVQAMFRFRETPATWDQWERVLDAIRKQLAADDYVLPQDLGPFRTSDTRQMWARKLNVLAAAVDAGVDGDVPAP